MVEFDDNKIILAFFVGVVLVLGVGYVMNNLNKGDISGKVVDITGRQVVNITIGGGITEDIPLGKGIANSTTFGFDWGFIDSDISSLQDTQINFQNKLYDVHEEMVLSKYSPSVEISLTSQDDDYTSNVFLETRSKGIKVFYVFDDKINVSKATSSNPLEINFLDKKIKIINVGSDHKFTALIGGEYFMDVGDTVTVNGKNITLQNVGEGGSVLVDVDEVRATIPAETEVVVNGISIYNFETYYTNELSERSAVLNIGNDALVTYQDGDAYIGEDENDPDWEWSIANLRDDASTTINSTQSEFPQQSPAGPTLGIQNAFTKDDDTDNPVGVGSCYILPNNYVSICLDSLTVPDNDYLEVTMKHTTIDTAKSGHPEGRTSAEVIEISALGNNRFNLGGHLTSQIWLQVFYTGVIGIFYKDLNQNPDLQFYNAYDFNSKTEIASIEFGDTSGNNAKIKGELIALDYLGISVDMSGDYSAELMEGEDSIVTEWSFTNGGFVSLGRTPFLGESGEIEWHTLHQSTNLISIGNKNEDHRTKYGVIVKNPALNSASDQVILLVPSDQVQGNVKIFGYSEVVCIDSDSGINYYIKGYATGYSSSEGRVVNKEDYCWVTSSSIPVLSGPYAIDWFCEGNILFGSSTNCSCYDGVCFTTTTTTTTTSTSSSTSTTTLPRCGRDSFNRVNSNNLGSEWIVVGGSWQISANKAYSTNNPYSVAYWKNQMMTTDSFSQAVFQATSYPSVDLVGPAVHIKDANNFYALVGISMDKSVYLIKREKGKDTYLGWYGLPDITTTLALKASGNQIIPIMNDVKKPAVTDFSATSGYSGIVKMNSYAAGNLDDWTMCESTIF